MVKRQDQGSAERRKNQGENECQRKANKIGASTAYGFCRERLSPFGGLLGLVKFLDLVRFQEIFEGFYKPPERLPEMGHYPMVLVFCCFYLSASRGYGIFCIFSLTRWFAACFIGSSCLCDDLLAVRGFAGDQSGMSLLMVMSALRSGVAVVRAELLPGPYQHRHDGGDDLRGQQGRKGIIPGTVGRRVSVRCCVLSRRPGNILWASFAEGRPWEGRK
jgi:hypothetical protein